MQSEGSRMNDLVETYIGQVAVRVLSRAPHLSIEFYTAIHGTSLEIVVRWPEKKQKAKLSRHMLLLEGMSLSTLRANCHADADWLIDSVSRDPNADRRQPRGGP